MGLAVTIEHAKQDQAELLTQVQRAAAVTAFAHVFPQGQYPFPDEAIRSGWDAALSDPNEN